MDQDGNIATAMAVLSFPKKTSEEGMGPRRQARKYD
jgi:hypothetical protein